MAESLLSILTASVIALAAFGYGRPLLRFLQISPDDTLEEVVWSLALGLLAVGPTFLALAVVGGLYELSVLIVTCAGLLWATVELACLLAGRQPGGPSPTKLLRQLFARRHAALVGLVMFGTIVLAAGLARALAPPIAEDVLARSLAAPKLTLEGGGHAGGALKLPNLSQVWSLWALALDGPVAANLLHWGLGVLLILAVVVLARPLLGRQWAHLAGAAVLAVPALQRELGMPLEAIPLALVATLALAAASRLLLQFEKGRVDIVAGLFVGAAIAIEPAGILFAGALLVTAGYFVWFKPRDNEDLQADWYRMALAASLFAVPWLAVGAPRLEVSHGTPALVSLGPICAVACGGLVFARRLRGLHWLLCVSLVFGGLALVTGFRGAAWAPLVPLAGVAAAWTWHEMRGLAAEMRWSVVTMCLAVVALDLAMACRTAVPCVSVAVGLKSREAYLLEHEESYRAASLLNAINPNREAVLIGNARGFYINGPTQPVDRFAGPTSGGGRAQMVLAAASRAGASYVLWSEPVETADASSPRQASKRAPATPPAANSENLPPGREVIPILEYQFADENNRRIRYRLWKLHGLEPAADAPATVAPVDRDQRVGRLPRPSTR